MRKGILHDGLRNHLDSWDGEEDEVKEENLDKDDMECEDERTLTDCNDVSVECDIASTVPNKGT